MQVKTLNTGIETVTVETEVGTRLTLTIVGSDGCNYAVRWDAGDRWMCGEFVDGEDSGELYEINDEDREFTCDDNTKLVTVKMQCGGFKWEESEEVEADFTNSDAYHTGFEAAAQGEPRSNNPYAVGGWGRDAWFAGWDAN